MDYHKKQYEVEFTEESIEEISEIYEYISKKLLADEAIKKLLQKMKKSILNLSYMPYLHMKIGKTDRLKREYHRIVVNNFIVLYTIDEENKKVFIAHIYYSKRNYLA